MNEASRKATLARVTFCLVLVFGVPAAWAGQIGIYQHGTVVRMRMGDCAAPRHGFMAAFSGAATPAVPEACPEYTLVSDKVVFVIVGSSSGQLVPLADVIDFRLHHNELDVRLDDAGHVNKFSIREMVLREEWDLVQKHVADRLDHPSRTPDAASLRTE